MSRRLIGYALLETLVIRGGRSMSAEPCVRKGMTLKWKSREDRTGESKSWADCSFWPNLDVVISTK